MSRYLLLWLEGPLQSWGADSKFGRRDTLNFPTKSGVLGMLLSALGASGEQTDLLASLSDLRQTVVAYGRVRQGHDGKPIRVDAEPLLRDFQMVGSGYHDENPWEALLIPKTIEGKKAVGGGTKMTYRYYLQDTAFAVLVEVPVALAEPFAEALQRPVYDVYLGRKNCVPTDYIFRGIYDSEADALIASNDIATQKQRLEAFLVKDGEDETGNSMTLNDVPLQFGPVKRYRDRRVTVINHE